MTATPVFDTEVLYQLGPNLSFTESERIEILSDWRGIAEDKVQRALRLAVPNEPKIVGYTLEGGTVIPLAAAREWASAWSGAPEAYDRTYSQWHVQVANALRAAGAGK